MAKFDLKILDGKLVIDMGYNENDVLEAYGYDGKPSKVDICELAEAKIIGTVELSQEQLERIQTEYKNGGECDWCDEVVSELSGPHSMDFVPGKKMCRNCWEMDRETYKGSVGEDIGPFIAKK